MRCTYVSGSLGMSKLTTAWTAGTSRPRAATSVATSTGTRPACGGGGARVGWVKDRKGNRIPGHVAVDDGVDGQHR
eukprot:364533-Chlamydomonas_euryale.AAC.1